MKNNILHSTRTTQSLIYDIKNQLPRAAELLGKATSEVYVCDFSTWDDDFMKSNFRDIVIREKGVIEGVPDIKRKNRHCKGIPGYGLYLYESKTDPSLRYVLMAFVGKYSNEELYIVVPKGQLFKLKRTIARTNKKINNKTVIPVLKDGMLEDIFQNTVGFLLKSKEIKQWGVRIKRGIILDGPPGNGKSMVCRYLQTICDEHDIDWGIISASDMDSAYHDKELDMLLSAYSVTFFDDIDIQYMDRRRGNGKMACSLLTAMDGLTQDKNLIRIFTTNESVGSLDEAFIRPGRIDRCITLEKPTIELRKKLIENYWSKELVRSIDSQQLIESTEGFSFAELEAVKTSLVANWIFNGNTWNLEKAITDITSQQFNRTKEIGFKS